MLPPTVEDPCPHFCPPHGCRKRANAELTGWGVPLPASSSTTWCPPPKGLGATSPLPSVVTVGVMGFLHTEGLRSVSLERWEGAPGGRGNRARSTDTIFQGEQPQRLVRRMQSAGQGGRQEGAGRAPRHHCGSAFRMAFTSSATAVSANSNWSCRSTAGDMRVAAIPAPGAMHACVKGEDPQFGAYLGLHHTRPLISDVLQRSSYVYLLHPCGRGREEC